ncbi:MAG: alpha/beta hydrolase [Pseudomonadota bacterium]
MNAHATITDASVTSTAGQLFVTESGAGAPFLLWPSIFTDHRLYDPILPLLPGRRVIRIDGPGHGRSGPLPEARAPGVFGRAILDVMDALELERAALGGTSWGGIAAAQAALTAPERVEKLVLMNTPLHLGEKSPSLGTRFIAAGARWAPGARLFRNGVAKSFFADPSLAAHPAFRSAFHAMLAEADGAALGPAVRSVLFDGPPLAPHLAELNVPTLMIAGREDPMYPVEAMQRAAAENPRITFQAVAGRHISVIDATEAVAASLNRFLT